MTTADQQQIQCWFDMPNDLLRYRPGRWLKTDVPNGGRWNLRRDEWITTSPDDLLTTPRAYIAGIVCGETEPGIWRPLPPYRMTLLYRVSPCYLGQGYAAATIRALLKHPSTRDISEFRCTIAATNEPSRRAALATGFTIIDTITVGDETKHQFVLKRKVMTPGQQGNRLTNLTCGGNE